MKIFVINPGSTSTKLALYEDEECVRRRTVYHPKQDLARFEHVNDQFAYRDKVIRDTLVAHDLPLEFDAVIARGGLLRPLPGGVYKVTEAIKHDLKHAEMQHVSNLGALIADDLAREAGCPAFIADPEVVDELMPEARLTGLPRIRRKSVFHALNSKAVSRHYASSIGRRYEDLNLIVAHLGGGISVSAHRQGRVIDVNNALNGDGPFSPERAGTLPADQLVEMCFSGEYTKSQIKNMLNGHGGLAAHLGITDMKEITGHAIAGEEPYRHVVEAMMYSVAKEVGARYVALRGKVDAIIITGGIANSEYCVGLLRGWIDCLGNIVVMPGEDEMASLAYNALGVLRGDLQLQEY